MKVITVYDSANFKPDFVLVKDRYVPLYSDLKTAICDLNQGSGILQLPALLTEQKIIIVDGTTETTTDRMPNLEAMCELFGYGYTTYRKLQNDLEAFLGEDIYAKKYVHEEITSEG